MDVNSAIAVFQDQVTALTSINCIGPQMIDNYPTLSKRQF